MITNVNTFIVIHCIGSKLGQSDNRMLNKV